MHIGKPIDAAKLEAFEGELPHASVPLVAIDEAREQVLSEIVVKPPSLVLGEDELSLAAAIHNLLFLAHPDTDGWSQSSRSRAKVIASAQAFAARPRTMNRRRILARHGLLHNFFQISRHNVKLIWWTGSASFHGQEPPRRLTRWPDLRRVSREETQTGFRELFQGADVAAVVVALVRRSPLSQLLVEGNKGPHLHWEDGVFLLRDAELARAVAYASLRGSDPIAITSAPARFAASFEQMLERTPNATDVRTVAAFLVHLSGLLALREVGLREKSPLIASVLSASQRARGLASFFALPDALKLADPRLAAPPGLLALPALGERWQVHREQVREFLGEGVVEGLAERLRRHLVGMLESHPPPDGNSAAQIPT